MPKTRIAATQTNKHLRAESEEQSELKEKLEAGEYEPFLSLYLDFVGQTICRISLRSTPVPYWISALAISVGILAISLLTSLALSEFDDPIRAARLPSEIALVAIIFLGTLILKWQLDLTYQKWRDHLIDALQTEQDLNALESWFRAVSHWQRQLSIALLLGLAFGIYAVTYVSNARGGFIGVGPTLLDMLINIHLVAGLYYVWYFIRLTWGLRACHFALFEINPNRSETIYHLSTMLYSYVYGTAIYVTAISIVLSVFAVMNATNILILLLAGWAPIVIAFVLAQIALSSIISTSKWQILTKVQRKIELLLAQDSKSEEETLEAVNRLLDFHDRVWSAGNSSLGITAVVTIVNSLLLPLISIVLTQMIDYALSRALPT
jgi:hypothetical protein